MKNLFVFFSLALISITAQAGKDLPQSIDFTFSAQTAAEIANKEFCRLSAGTETYNHFYGGSTKSEFLRITCDGTTLGIGGKVSRSGHRQRVDEILSYGTSQLLKMGFKVVSCESDKMSYEATCTVAKQVMPTIRNSP